MARWTVDKDIKLIRWGALVGYDKTARLDLNMQDGYGRFQKLRKTGKAYYIARSQLAKAELEMCYISDRNVEGKESLIEEISFWRQQFKLFSKES